MDTKELDIKELDSKEQKLYFSKMQEIFVEAYKQGVKDGVNDMHISPQHAFERYLKVLTRSKFARETKLKLSEESIH